MHRSRPSIPLAAAFVVAAFPSQGDAATAQRRDVVSSRVEVSNSVASLRLDFSDGERLTLSFAEGLATLDGEPLGSYEPGGASDRAWRSLLAGVLSLSDGPLARELDQWSPGQGTAGEDRELLQKVDEALERAVANRGGPRRPDEAPAGPDARPGPPPEPPSFIDRARLREEIRRELETEMSARRPSHDRSAPRALRAAEDVLGTVFAFLVTGGLALLLMRFAGVRLDSVTREIQYHPGRAAAVGFTGGFLLLPVFVIGTVVLAVSLIGILLLPVWVLLFPLAAGLAGFTGYVAVSHHVGRWVLDQGWPWLDRVDRGRDTHVRLTGLAALLLPCAAGSVLAALPLIGWVGGVLKVLGILAGVAAVIVGFGAVIITRGGRYATGWPGSLDDELETAAEWSSGDDLHDASEAADLHDAPDMHDAPEAAEEKE